GDRAGTAEIDDRLISIVRALRQAAASEVRKGRGQLGVHVIGTRITLDCLIEEGSGRARLAHADVQYRPLDERAEKLEPGPAQLGLHRAVNELTSLRVRSTKSVDGSQHDPRRVVRRVEREASQKGGYGAREFRWLMRRQPAHEMSAAQCIPA